jgi:hypothetical protein
MNALKATVTMTFATVLLAAVLVAPFGAQVADGAITVRVPFDSGFAPTTDVNSNFTYLFQVGAATTVDANAGLFGGALVSPAANSSANWCGGTSCMHNGAVGPEGTIEFFVSPNWAGTAQGGSSIGGSGSNQTIMHMGGAITGASSGLNIGIFNNNYPASDGGQIFASLKDSSGVHTFESDYHPSSGHEHGSTKYWAAGSWHHIAFTWDTDFFTLWMDGDQIKKFAADGDTISWPADIWLGGTYNGGSNSWDGNIDEFVIRDNVQYDPSQLTYDVPTRVLTFVAPEPATLSMLGIGGLGLLRRRR